jgi:hypothetical protein
MLTIQNVTTNLRSQEDRILCIMGLGIQLHAWGIRYYKKIMNYNHVGINKCLKVPILQE